MTRLLSPAHFAQFFATLTALCAMVVSPSTLSSESGWPGLTLSSAILFDLTLGALIIERLTPRWSSPGFNILWALFAGVLVASVLLPSVRTVALIGAVAVSLALCAQWLRRPGQPWRLRPLYLLLVATWLPTREEGITLTTHQRGNWVVYVWLYVLMNLPLHIMFVFTGLHVISMLDIVFSLGLALLARSFRTSPSLLTPTHLNIRMGALSSAGIPLDTIESVQPYSAEKSGLSLVQLTPPNVTIRLSQPVLVRSLLARPRLSSQLYVYLDDLAALSKQLATR